MGLLTANELMERACVRRRKMVALPELQKENEETAPYVYVTEFSIAQQAFLLDNYYDLSGEELEKNLPTIPESSLSTC